MARDWGLEGATRLRPSRRSVGCSIPLRIIRGKVPDRNDRLVGSFVQSERSLRLETTNVDAGYIHYAHRRPRELISPDELKVKLFRAARGSLYRNDIDPCALPAIAGRNATLN
jgi:hypothetical protein